MTSAVTPPPPPPPSSTPPPPSPQPGSEPLLPFSYEAQTADGQTLRGTLEARSANEVHTLLAGMQLRVLNVDPQPTTPVRRKSPLGPDDFLMFNQQLAHLTAAGLPVERGLRLIAADLRIGRLSGAAKAVAGELEHGATLEQAFSHHASRFPSLYGKLIDAGVKSGNLPAMLFNLGHHLELVAKLRQALWRTFAYPLMVFGAMSLVIIFLAEVVIPQFRDIFSEFRTTLPMWTQFVFAAAEIFPTVLMVAAWVLAVVIVFLIILRVMGKTGILADRIFLWVPLVGPVLRASLLARWIDALRLSIDAGLDLPHAVALASDASGSSRLAAESEIMVNTMLTGRPFTAFNGRVIPQTVPAAIELASHSGDLQSTLATLTRLYQAQAEQLIRIVPVLITPLAIFGLGAAVISIVMAMFLPLVQLWQSFGGL